MLSGAGEATLTLLIGPIRRQCDLPRLPPRKTPEKTSCRYLLYRNQTYGDHARCASYCGRGTRAGLVPHTKRHPAGTGRRAWPHLLRGGEDRQVPYWLSSDPSRNGKIEEGTK
jgi:hypothetical protein